MSRRLHIFVGAVFVSAFGVEMNAQKTAQASPLQENGVTFIAISDNGAWAVGSTMNDGNDVCPTIWDLTQDKTIMIAPDENYIAGVNDISDDGCAVGQIEGDFFTGKPAYYKNGKWTVLPMPEGFSGGTVTSITPDGKTMCGNVIKSPSDNWLGYDAVMVKWVDGQVVLIDSPADRLGEYTKNDRLLGISSDGSKMIGQLGLSVMNNLTQVVYDQGEWSLVGQEFFNEPDNYTYFDNPCISPNLKWIAGHMEYDTYAVADQYGGAWSVNRHYVFNTETKELLLDVEKGPQGMGCAMSNEGVAFIGLPHNYPIRQAVVKIPNDDRYYSMTEYIQSEYGLNVESVGYSDWGTVTGISADGKTLIGFEGPGHNWVMKLSDPILPSETAITQTQMNANDMSATLFGRDLYIYGNVKQVSLLTLDGKTLFSQAVTETVVSLNSFDSGAYVVVLHDDNGATVNTKVILK